VVIEAGLADLAVGEVNDPAVQGGGTLVGPMEVCREHSGRPYDVQDNGVAVAVGVE
jgi:hypothetical protein